MKDLCSSCVDSDSKCSECVMEETDKFYRSKPILPRECGTCKWGTRRRKILPLEVDDSAWRDECYYDFNEVGCNFNPDSPVKERTNFCSHYEQGGLEDE